MPALLKNETSPAAFSLATTRFGMVTPAVKLRFELSGRSSPAGQTVTNPATVGVTAVTFIATAVTPDGGTSPTPATFRVSTPWLPRAAGPP